MGFLRELFGPSKEDVWRQLAGEMNGRFNGGGWFGADNVQVRVGDWILTLDTYTVSTGKSSTTYTRIRAPFINRDGFRFSIHRAGVFTKLGKLFGMQDLEVGDPLFDEQFVIQSNHPEKVGFLLSTPRVRELLLAQPQVGFQVQDDEGWFGASFPEGVDQIHFQIHGVLTNLDHLRGLFELFSELLNRVCHMDSAYKDDFTILWESLSGPGGQIKSGNLVLWDGEVARHRAVQGLGNMTGDRRAVDALVSALPNATPALRHDIIRALGGLADRRAVPSLIPYLGQFSLNGYWDSLSAAADGALRRLGEANTADTFAALLKGDVEAQGRLRDEWRALFILALRAALASPSASQVVAAARALVEWNVQEAVPEIRQAIRTWKQDPAIRQSLDASLEELDKRAALPRPATAPAIQPDGTLPLPASAALPDAASLPRPGSSPE